MGVGPNAVPEEYRNAPTLADLGIDKKLSSRAQKLATCERVDECKDWADKSAALASYARQAEDTTLMNHAMRIQARAVRRAGELLKRVDGRQGQNLPNAKSVVAPTFNREQAATNAEMSPHQRVQAVRVANVTEQTWNNWKKKDPDFFESLKDWRERMVHAARCQLYDGDDPLGLRELAGARFRSTPSAGMILTPRRPTKRPTEQADTAGLGVPLGVHWRTS